MKFRMSLVLAAVCLLTVCLVGCGETTQTETTENPSATDVSGVSSAAVEPTEEPAGDGREEAIEQFVRNNSNNTMVTDMDNVISGVYRCTGCIEKTSSESKSKGTYYLVVLEIKNEDGSLSDQAILAEKESYKFISDCYEKDTDAGNDCLFNMEIANNEEGNAVIISAEHVDDASELEE